MVLAQIGWGRYEPNWGPVGSPISPLLCPTLGSRTLLHPCRVVGLLPPTWHARCQGAKPHAHTLGALALVTNSLPVEVSNLCFYPSRIPNISYHFGCCFATHTLATRGALCWWCATGVAPPAPPTLPTWLALSLWLSTSLVM